MRDLTFIIVIIKAFYSYPSTYSQLMSVIYVKLIDLFIH